MSTCYYVVDAEKKEAFEFVSESFSLDEVRMEAALREGFGRTFLEQMLLPDSAWEQFRDDDDECEDVEDPFLKRKKADIESLLAWLDSHNLKQVAVIRGEENRHQMWKLGIRLSASNYGDKWVKLTNAEADWIEANLDPDAPPAVLPLPKLMPLEPREPGSKKISRSLAGVPTKSASLMREEMEGKPEIKETNIFGYVITNPYGAAEKVIRELALELAGEASMAWDTVPTGVFRSDLAGKAVDRFMKQARYHLDQEFARGQQSMLPLVFDEMPTENQAA